MKLISQLLILITSCALSVSSEKVDAKPKPDYGKIFAGKKWKTSVPFLSWAKILPLHKPENVKCSKETKKRLVQSGDKVLYCEEVATLKREGHNEPVQLVWAVLRSTAPSPYGHDCKTGIVYLDKKQTINTGDLAICKYALEIEDPADTPVLAFQVAQTGEMGVVFDGHGAECGGRAVLKQEGDSFKRIHEFYWNCSH